MSVNILIQDLYLDFTCSKEISVERRFFVEIELNKNNQEILVFMNEMNSVFHKTKNLSNVVLLDNKDLAYEFSNNEKSTKPLQDHKELLILEKEKIFSMLKKLVIHNIESRSEDEWLNFCKTIYTNRNVEFNATFKQFEIEKFNKSNEEIKTLWNNFPTSAKEYKLGGELMRAETIPHKLSTFWSEIYFLHLNNKFEDKSIKEKKPKI